MGLGRMFFLTVFTLVTSVPSFAETVEKRLKWIHTSDLHSSFFAFDYLKNRPIRGGLSAVYAYTDSLRRTWGDDLILTDGGDVLQGQPISYYYNFVDTKSTHLLALMMNRMGYVAACIGNHDIETGHPVYDRWRRQLNFPLLGANVVDMQTGKPYLQPYVVVERQGLKIAVLGMITPAIPNWLPAHLWSGLRFDDILKTARRWVPLIMEKEKPDLLVGLFHCGLDGGIQTEAYIENATLQVAREVPEFNAIFYGHDHVPHAEVIKRPDGSQCAVLGPASSGSRVCELDIKLTLNQDSVTAIVLEPHTVEMTMGQSQVAKAFERQFASQLDKVENWVNEDICRFTAPFVESESFFGPSAFMDIIHAVQLNLTKADISLASPLSFDNRIDSGRVTVRDMFSLYKYENSLYVMRLKGHEIKNLLEMSYGMWVNQMQSPDDHLLLFGNKQQQARRRGLKENYYNFDSAAGLKYVVDVTKPKGERVKISKMSDNRPFEMDAWYKVAVNAYRANGGGDLLTKGAGIPHDVLPSRVVSCSIYDMRYMLIHYLREKKELSPFIISRWHFEPREWVEAAASRDSLLLFGEPNSVL